MENYFVKWLAIDIAYIHSYQSTKLTQKLQAQLPVATNWIWSVKELIPK